MMFRKKRTSSFQLVRLCNYAAILALASCSAADAPKQATTLAPPVEAPRGAPTIDHARLIAAQDESSSWLSYGRTYNEQRYSPLAKINDANAAQLGLDWSHDLETSRGQQSTPLLIDGVLYVTQSWSKVVALEARTGKMLWAYDPKVPGETGFKACCDVVNRGLAAWGDRLFLGTLDGRLVAIDRKSGKELWSKVTVDQSLPYTITGAPRVIKGKVIIGNGGADYGVRGYVTAYDAETGAQAWRFYTVPGDPKKGFEAPHLAAAAKSWNGEWWKNGGGGTVWDAMAYDPDLDTLYIGVGNGSPWNQKIRSPGGGDNLYLSSIVALNPNTGSYKWHYQTTPGETWDYTATQHIILADMTIDGAKRKVLMQAPKNGFFYVIDRVTGKLISAKNYVPTTWASHVDMATARPVEIAGARYQDQPALVTPSALGGHNWHPMAYNPNTNLVYIPAQEIPMVYAGAKDDTLKPGRWNVGIDFLIAAIPDDKAQRKALRSLLKGHLSAWDPVAQKEVWRANHGGPWNGGVLTTGGNLVFQGTANGIFNAYRADTGARLWSFDAQTGILPGAITYELDGQQYITLVVGSGGIYPLSSAFVDTQGSDNRSRVLTFKLGGKAALPPLETVQRNFPDLPAKAASKRLLAQGRSVYYNNCGVCHGEAAVNGGVIPDLRTSAALADKALWKEIVHDGALKDAGMIGFGKYLSIDETEAARLYVIEQAKRYKQELAQDRNQAALTVPQRPRK
jgi:quinohemoprotein ethanol dehydrogenase